MRNYFRLSISICILLVVVAVPSLAQDKVLTLEDFLKRMQQYFDHHLKGVPAPAWMTEGVPFLKKGQVNP